MDDGKHARSPRRVDAPRSKNMPSYYELEEIYDGTVPQNHDGNGTLASYHNGTVDGRNPANQVIYSRYTVDIVYQHLH